MIKEIQIYPNEVKAFERIVNESQSCYENAFDSEVWKTRRDGRNLDAEPLVVRIETPDKGVLFVAKTTEERVRSWTSLLENKGGNVVFKGREIQSCTTVKDGLVYLFTPP